MRMKSNQEIGSRSKAKLIMHFNQTSLCSSLNLHQINSLPGIFDFIKSRSRQHNRNLLVGIMRIYQKLYCVTQSDSFSQFWVFRCSTNRSSIYRGKCLPEEKTWNFYRSIVMCNSQYWVVCRLDRNNNGKQILVVFEKKGISFLQVYGVSKYIG